MGKANAEDQQPGGAEESRIVVKVGATEIVVGYGDGRVTLDKHIPGVPPIGFTMRPQEARKVARAIRAILKAG